MGGYSRGETNILIVYLKHEPLGSHHLAEALLLE
jgi:hypothetical protein